MGYKFLIPQNWIESSLQEFCVNVADGTHDSPKRTEKGKLLVTSKNIVGGTLDFSKSYFISEEDFNDVNRRSKVDINDVLLSMIGTVGEVCLIEHEPDFAIKNVGLLKNSDQLKARWLYFYLISPQAQAQIKERLRGTTQQYLPLGEIRKFPIIFPQSRVEMKNIVTVLSVLQDKIQLNHQINQTLEQIAQALFKSWFVDFDPVKAKIDVLEAGGSEEEALIAAMQVISSKNAEELAAFEVEKPEEYAQLRATAELFPAAMVESELGEIPEGWEALPFGNFLSKTIGGDWGKEQPDEKHTTQVKIIRGTDLPKIYAGDDSNVPVRFVEPRKLKTRKLEAGDIVIEVSGGSKNQPTGRSLFFSNTLINRLEICEPASFCRLFRPLNPNIGLILGVHLQHIYSEGKTWQYQNQSTGISNFQTKVFLEHELVVTPPEEVQKRFFSLVMPLINQIHSNDIAPLAELRDTLLPKLLSGELDASELVDSLEAEA